MSNETVWPTAEQQATWRSFLAANAVLEETLDRQLERSEGLPHTYCMILAMLSEAKEHRLRMQDLAKITLTSQSRLSHAVSKMENAGWVERSKDTADKRGIYVSLTTGGLDKIRQAAPGHVNEVRERLFAPLTDEQVDQLKAICDAIVNASPPSSR